MYIYLTKFLFLMHESTSSFIYDGYNACDLCYWYSDGCACMWMPEGCELSVIDRCFQMHWKPHKHGNNEQMSGSNISGGHGKMLIFILNIIIT